MIKSWANSATRKFAETAQGRFAGMDQGKAQRRIADLNRAESLSELSPLKSAGLHKLKGDRKGQWAMTINGPWRLVFRFEDGNALDVEIVDYH